jgi:hypothetical protein
VSPTKTICGTLPDWCCGSRQATRNSQPVVRQIYTRIPCVEEEKRIAGLVLFTMRPARVHRLPRKQPGDARNANMPGTAKPPMYRFAMCEPVRQKLISSDRRLDTRTFAFLAFGRSGNQSGKIRPVLKQKWPAGSSVVLYVPVKYILSQYKSSNKTLRFFHSPVAGCGLGNRRSEIGHPGMVRRSQTGATDPDFDRRRCTETHLLRNDREKQRPQRTGRRKSSGKTYRSANVRGREA